MLFVDISDYQAGFDLERYSWPLIVLKASEGQTWRSKTMAAWRRRAHELGLVVGLYHYLRANPAVDEARNFAVAVGELQADEFAVCDWEAAGVPPALASGWLELVEGVYGRRPVLYSYTSYLATQQTGYLTRWPLWVANYGPNDGTVRPNPGTDRWAPYEAGPGEWPHEARTIAHQFTSEGRAPGWGGRLDVNRTEMSIDAWRRLAGGSAAPPDRDRHRADVVLLANQ